MALVLALILTFLIGNCESQLQVGFYSTTCPNAEPIVRSIVRDSVLSDPTLAAALLRLHFHDCFVLGCDGSILIDNGPESERHAVPHQGLKGFQVIERAKAQLEATCPGVVSCADIVALAARDAVAMARGPAYEVPTGRRDGLASNISFADDMPDVTDSVQVLKTKFLNKGLLSKDLVLLSAAHTIGTTACFFMTQRLYNFGLVGASDPSISPSFLPQLKARCPQNGDVNARLFMDEGSGQLFDKHILQNIREGLAVLQSDASLNDDPTTRAVIDSYFGAFNPFFSFESDFVDSIVKMGQIGVNTGFSGEIRRFCNAFNN